MQGSVSLLQLTIAVVGLIAIALLVRITVAARQGIAHWSRAIGFAAWIMIGATVTVGVFAFWFAPSLKPHVSIVAGLATVIGFSYKMSRKRSRYIPRSVKRSVIARDLKGQPYDPKQHHIDHIWPHSRWGSNTEDNLRVISKNRNLRKGARLPKVKDWF